MQYEREINEHTDLGSLTDQEISRLMEGMDGDVLKQVGLSQALLTIGSCHWPGATLSCQEGIP